MRFKAEKLLIFVVLTRLFLLVFPWITNTLLFPEKSPLNFLQFTQTAWNRWDAPHYLYLAQNWYTTVGDPANFIVFFPLYPLVIKPLVILTQNAALSGIFASTIFFVLGAYYFYKLVAIDYPEKIARWAVVTLAIFPTSFFFNAPYTESLFILLLCLSFYCARKERWILSGLFAGLGTLTRPYGFLITIAVLIEWFMFKKRKWIYLPLITIPTILTGLFYIYLNQSIYGDPFMFQKILESHWQKRLMSPYLSIKDSWDIALGGGLTNFVILVGWAEAITATISWVLIPFAFKYLRRSWAVFYTLNILLFSSTSFILSTPRYLLSVPPLFLLIALAQRNYLFRIVWNFASVGLLFCLAILFTRGQWAF